MIEEYITQSRRIKRPTPLLIQKYHATYAEIQRILAPEGDAPKLFVLYSSERRCEYVKIDGVDYILYDQYLGQSLNQLNRILLSEGNQSHLAQGYACKFLAERLLTFGCLGLSQFFGLCYRQMSNRLPASKVKTDSFRLELTHFQELFVLAHEMSHHVFSQRKVDQDRIVSKLLEDFFYSKATKGPTDSESADGEEDIQNYYRSIMAGHEAEYLPEIFADHSGAIACIKLADGEVEYNSVILGIILAFKYTRIFRHLELLARRLAALESVSNDTDFSNKLTEIDKEIWDENERLIQFYQLREHFIRFFMRRYRDLSDDIKDKDESIVAEWVGNFDEYIESPIVFGLVDRLKQTLKYELIVDLREPNLNRPPPIEMTDLLTGWDQSRNLANLHNKKTIMQKLKKAFRFLQVAIYRRWKRS